MEFIQQGVCIGQGAEAKVYKIDFLGEPAALKERLPKKYRHPELDKKLTNERLQSECKLMARARKAGVNTPFLLSIDLDRRYMIMQYVEGMKLKDWLKAEQQTLHQILQDVGRNIALLHSDSIVHGDLTTSNIIVSEGGLYIIDFGLSYIRNNVEDFAVDLYVLEKAFLSTHPELEQDFQIVLNGYLCRSSVETLNHLNAVRQRGRKKLAFG